VSRLNDYATRTDRLRDCALHVQLLRSAWRASRWRPRATSSIPTYGELVDDSRLTPQRQSSPTGPLRLAAVDCVPGRIPVRGVQCQPFAAAAWQQHAELTRRRSAQVPPRALCAVLRYQSRAPFPARQATTAATQYSTSCAEQGRTRADGVPR